MKLLLLLLAGVPCFQALCVVNQCSSWWSANKNNVSGVCAVIFDENCCKVGDTNYSIKIGEKGKLCSTGSSLNPFSSCKGPRLDNDVESFIVMPGCKLEVWDDEDGVEDAEAEERKGFNQGNLKDAKDRYDQEKLVIEARNSPHWVEEMNDDFDDMNEDISSYRWRQKDSFYCKTKLFLGALVEIHTELYAKYTTKVFNIQKRIMQ